jgi:hypothetical protein
MIDGECVERFWSVFNKYSFITPNQSTHRRLETLEDGFLFLYKSKLQNLLKRLLSKKVSSQNTFLFQKTRCLKFAEARDLSFSDWKNNAATALLLEKQNLTNPNAVWVNTLVDPLSVLYTELFYYKDRLFNPKYTKGQKNLQVLLFLIYWIEKQEKNQ